MQTARPAGHVPAKPSLGSSSTDGRPSPPSVTLARVFRRNRTGKTGGWDSRFVSSVPPGMPTVNSMLELDLSSGLYDVSGVCVVLG